MIGKIVAGISAVIFALVIYNKVASKIANGGD